MLISRVNIKTGGLCESTLACSVLSYSDEAHTHFILILFFFAVDQVKFGPPRRKVTEPYPDLVMHVFVRELFTGDIHEYDQALFGFPFQQGSYEDDWSLSGDEDNSP